MKFWSCRDVSRMIASGEFDEATGPRKLLARLHLLGCRYCRRFLREMSLISSAARNWSESLLSKTDLKAYERRLIKRLVPGI